MADTLDKSGGTPEPSRTVQEEGYYSYVNPVSGPSLDKFKAARQTALDRGTVLDLSVQPEGDAYWEDPQRVVRYRNFLRSQPPDFQPPDWMKPDQLEQAYQYLKFRNNDKPWQEWQRLPANDPGISFLRGIDKPPVQMQPTWDQTWEPPKTGDPRLAGVVGQGPLPDPFGNWDSLTPAEKFYLGAFSPQPGLPGRPEWTRTTAALGQGALAVPGGAAVGAALGGPIGALIGGGIALAGTTFQAYTGQRVPILADALDVFNLLPMGAERVIGVVGQAQAEGWDKVMADLPAAWKAANLTYETQQADLLNIYAKITNPIARALGGQEMQIARPDQVWQISRGIPTPQALVGPRGAAALAEARRRLDNNEDPLQLYTEYQSRFGDTGTFNDFIMQTLVDPTNLVPFATGKIGEGAARLLGNERLALALGEGVGNPLVDALPGGEFLARQLGLNKLGIHGSEGLLASVEKYRNWIQTGYFPEGTAPKAAVDLSSFEKWAGGLTKAGEIKDIQPTPDGQHGVVGWVQYLNSLTPEAKATTFLSLFHDNINVVMSMADSHPDEMVKFLHQAAAIDPVAVGDVGQAVLQSPATATISQALRDVLRDGWDQEMLLRWTESQGKRDILEKVARALNEKPGEILDEYRTAPEALMKRIQERGGVQGGDPAMLREVFDVFTGEDALPWSENQFQAQLSTTIFDKMDAWLVKRYNIKPDSGVLRLSQTLKGMQSLLLLGFNPAYFINNQVNNMVTRAATGVFGYMTPRQISAFLDRFGITPDRLADSVGAEAMTASTRAGIAKAKKSSDWIGKVQSVVSTTNQKLGVFSKFSSAGERLESSNAYTIGMLKFWGQSWKVDKGLRRMRPEVEALLDRQAPGIKRLIYSAAEAGMNMREIEGKLFGEAIRPEINQVIEDAARIAFPDHPESGAELIRATGIQAQLERRLAQANTPAEVRAVFDKVRADIQAVADEAHAREVAARAETVANRVQAEGHAGIVETLTQLADRIEHRANLTDTNSWNRAAAYANQTYAGLLRALRGDSKENKAATKTIVQAAKDFTAFDKARRKILADLATADDSHARELRVQLAELYRGYKEKAQASQAEIERGVQRATKPAEAATPAPTPAPEISERRQALNALAVEYGLTDTNGRPVMAYLMNVVNRARPKADRFTSPESVPLDVAEQALKVHRDRFEGAAAQAASRLALTVDDISKIADRQAREAEIQANGMLTRRMVREQLAEVFGASDAETEAALILMDNHADTVTRLQGRNPTEATRDAWYATRIAEIVKGDQPDVFTLHQKATEDWLYDNSSDIARITKADYENISYVTPDGRIILEYPHNYPAYNWSLATKPKLTDETRIIQEFIVQTGAARVIWGDNEIGIETNRLTPEQLRTIKKIKGNRDFVYDLVGKDLKNFETGAKIPDMLDDLERMNDAGLLYKSLYNNLYQQAYGNLVALHNLSTDKLIRADELGGLPVPSIAVVKAGQPYSAFGDITLIGRRDLVDPQARSTNRVFEADIYSPRAPDRVWAKVKTSKAEQVIAKFKETNADLGDYFTSEIWDMMVHSPDAERFAREFASRPTPMVVFLKEHGIAFEKPQRLAEVKHKFVSSKWFSNWLESEGNRAALEAALAGPSWKLYESPLYQGFFEAVKKSVDFITPAPGYAERIMKTLTADVAGGFISTDLIQAILKDYDTASARVHEVDPVAYPRAAEKQLRESGLVDEYKAWVRDLTRQTFGEPGIKLGSRVVDYNLDNIVAAMTRKTVRGGEGAMPSFGLARGQGAKEFGSVTAMHKAEGKLVTHEEFQNAKAAQDQRLAPYQSVISDYYDEKGYHQSFDMFDAAAEVLGTYLKGGQKPDPERMRRAFAANNFDIGTLEYVSPDYIDRALEAAQVLVDMPTEYFEAKPQRAVHFNEFAGAVVPQNADPRVLEILDRRGIPYQTYSSEADRTQKLSTFYQQDNVLFQSGKEARKNLIQIQELGFVSPESIKHLFEGGTPAYVRGLMRFLSEKKAKYDRGEMTVRDVAKAYLATVSSQGSDAITWDRLKVDLDRAGIKLERDGAPFDPTEYLLQRNGKYIIRPEEFAGLWMLTDHGKATLDALERGEITDGWRQFVQAREAFGRFGRGVKKVKNAEDVKVPTEYPGEWFIEKGGAGKKNLADIQEITNEINAAKGDSRRVFAAISKLAGVSEGKTGFVMHMIGFGTDTVVDTQQAHFWQKYLEGKPGVTKDMLESFDWGNWGKRGAIDVLKTMIEDAYQQLKAEGIGADIPPEMFTYLMHHWLWNLQKEAGGAEPTGHEILYRGLELGQENRGGVSFLQDGRAVIRGLEAPNVSTMVHEIGHIFRRDLQEADLDAVAKLGGLRDAQQMRDLEQRFQRGEIMPGDAEYTAYVQAEELFARGWERYLAEGDAPTPELRSVFGQFTDWMMNIYKRLRATLKPQGGGRDVAGFQNQPEFEVGGNTVNIRASVDGTNLRDIFDRLLAGGRQAEEAPAPTPPPPPPSAPESALVAGKVRDLPAQVQGAVKEVANQLLGELESSRVINVKYTEVEGGAEVTKYRREWEGPAWYRSLIDAARQVGQSGDDLKAKYRSVLKNIISGKDKADPALTEEIKQIIVDRAMGRDDIESNVQPAILRFMGANDDLFRGWGEAILSSEEPALRAMFGDEWEKVLEEYLVWAADHDGESGYSTADPVDVFGNPAESQAAPTLYQAGPPDQAQPTEPQPGGEAPAPETPTDLFGNPLPGFQLKAQEAKAQEFKPQAQAEQGALFDRSEFLPKIEAKKVEGEAKPEGTDYQPTLFQEGAPVQGNVPPGGTPEPEPYGSILDESVSEQVDPLLRAMETEYLKRLADRPLKFGDLDQQAQGEVKKWLNQLRGDMASTKFATMRYGEQMRDSALLNYNRRYGLDQVAEIVFPYQFWYTRSMIQWARRMIDRPAWFGMYARMQQAQERAAANMPDRLKGKMRLPAPWLPDWAGGGLWFDPAGKLLPFSTFGQPFERFAADRTQVETRAEQVLGQMVKAQTISQAEADQAMQKHTGQVWDRAMAQAAADTDKSGSPLSLVNMMMSPALWWTAGANILHGTPEKISPLPLTRTASAVQTATRGTPIQPLGDLVGLAAWPEKKAREAAGLSQFGEWGDYLIDRTLANMAADGTIDAATARVAMIQRSGPAFDEATQRVQYEQMLQTPGAGLLNQAAKGNAAGALQALPTVIFGGSLFPTGELKLRGLQDDYSQAWTNYKHGDTKAINAFFDQHPEYEARLALYDKPDERLRQFLISEVWDRYSALEKPNRTKAADQLGPDFRDAFLNSQTRSYDSIAPDTLARWAKMLGGLVPETPETKPVIEQQDQPLELYPPELARGIEAYQTERSSKFPNYFALQDQYYQYPEKSQERRNFLKRFPQLPQYWDWKKQYQQDHPELAPYFEESKTKATGQAATPAQAGPRLTDKELGQIDPVLMRQVMAWQMAGQTLTAGAYAELNRLAKSRKISADEYARLILSSMLPVQ